MRYLCTMFLLFLTAVVAAQTNSFSYVSDVVDAASYTPGIARGSLFVVKGTGLCPPGLQRGATPYSDKLSNVSMTLTPAAGGTPLKPYIVYTYSDTRMGDQIAAILPSAAKSGNYSLVVDTGEGTTASVNALVVDRKPRILTNNQQGFGTAVAQNYVSADHLDRNMFAVGALGDGQSRAPARPGQTLILWGLGLGAISRPDNDAPGVIDFLNQVEVRVSVGGVEASVAYAGRAPQFPGIDQVNFALPNDVITGCNVPLQLYVDGQASNLASLSIALPGKTACEHPLLSPRQLDELDRGATPTIGLIHLIRYVDPNIQSTGDVSYTRMDGALAAFTPLTAGDVGKFNEWSLPPGRCLVRNFSGSLWQGLLDVPMAYSLDAGPLTLDGPNLAETGFAADEWYGLLLSMVDDLTGAPADVNLNSPLTAGTYTVRTPGGAQVGPFEATLKMPEVLRWINRGDAAEVQRSKGVTLSWQGGSPTDRVVVQGYSGTKIGASYGEALYEATSFVCTAPSGATSFTVPPEVLQRLPATDGNLGNTVGVLALLNFSLETDGLFKAPLVKGGETWFGLFRSSGMSTQIVQYR